MACPISAGESSWMKWDPFTVTSRWWPAPAELSLRARQNSPRAGVDEQLGDVADGHHLE